MITPRIAPRSETLNFPGVTADVCIFEEYGTAVITLEQDGRCVIITGSEVLRLAKLLPDPYAKPTAFAAVC